jgi:Tol biopolymer transport system component
VNATNRPSALILLDAGSSGPLQESRWRKFDRAWPLSTSRATRRPTSIARSDSKAFPAECEDQNDLIDLYVLDLNTQRLTLESGQLGVVSRYSRVLYPRISGDGHLVVFQAAADDDVRSEVVVLDRLTRSARFIGTDPSRQAGGNSSPAISADGGTVVFESTSTTLVDHGDSHRTKVNVYLVRLGTDRVTAVSVAGNGELSDAGDSVTPVVSADGRYVAFMSTADLICAAASCSRTSRDPKRVADIYVRDTIANTTVRVSGSVTGTNANGPSSWPALSGDGRYVVFTSEASNLVRGDRNGQADIFLHDIGANTTELISRRPDGRSASGASRNPAISDDGSTVAFQSLASDLTCAKRCHDADRDINLVWDVFLFYRRSGAMLRASSDGTEEWMEPSRRPSLNTDGRVLIFSSHHPTGSDDAGGDDDLYVLVRLGSTERELVACIR